MENDVTRLQLAKMYIDCLANGVDPVYNTDINIDTLYNEQVVSCFKFISDILARDIYKEQDLVKPSNERISEEQSAGITHKNPCGIHIVRQEAEAGSGKDSRQYRGLEILLYENDAEERERHYAGNAAGESVKSVKKIYGVGKSDDPEHRYRYA